MKMFPNGHIIRVRLVPSLLPVTWSNRPSRRAQLRDRKEVKLGKELSCSMINYMRCTPRFVWLEAPWRPAHSLAGPTLSFGNDAQLVYDVQRARPSTRWMTRFLYALFGLKITASCARPCAAPCVAPADPPSTVSHTRAA